MSDEQAAQLVKRLLGSYPSLSLHDPRTYIAELVTILVRYPDWVGEKAIADAKRESPKFVPSAPEVEAACEAAVGTTRSCATYAQQWDERSRLQLEERKALEAQQKPFVPKGCFANVLVPCDAPQYQAMLDRAKCESARASHIESNGIWVPLGWLEEAKTAPSKGFRRYTGDELRAMYPAPQPGAPA